ncbi:hypothetical protein CC80DRAFT_511295 [Byssothecium circinans]|uniref:Uncharacterized protein n=1 Tax=Byssothecium circinans TaxID=147558 RepID=A0A6A5T9X9_9PLEO|nr:hypothetical protein CC80DRAFT_511295 [Byssothecium circinans]
MKVVAGKGKWWERESTFSNASSSYASSSYASSSDEQEAAVPLRARKARTTKGPGGPKKRVTMVATEAAETSTKREQRHLQSLPDDDASTTAEFIRVGHMLQAFAEGKHTRLRIIRGGRQSLERFARQHARPEDISFPDEWKDNGKAANRVLERWMRTPNNPFIKFDEDESTKGFGAFSTPRPRARARVESGRSKEQVAAVVAEATERARRTKKQLALAAAGEAALAAAAAKAAAAEAAAKAAAAAAAIAIAAEEGEDGEEDDEGEGRGREGGGSAPGKKAECFTSFYRVVCAIAPEDGEGGTEGGAGRAARCESNAGTESTGYRSYGDVAELDEPWGEELCRTDERGITGRASDAGTDDTDYRSYCDGAELDELCRSDAVNKT